MSTTQKLMDGDVINKNILDKELATKSIATLRSKIKYARIAYENDEPIISDSEYDILMRELMHAEELTLLRISKLSPSNTNIVPVPEGQPFNPKMPSGIISKSEAVDLDGWGIMPKGIPFKALYKNSDLMRINLVSGEILTTSFANKLSIPFRLNTSNFKFKVDDEQDMMELEGVLFITNKVYKEYKLTYCKNASYIQAVSEMVRRSEQFGKSLKAQFYDIRTNNRTISIDKVNAVLTMLGAIPINFYGKKIKAIENMILEHPETYPADFKFILADDTNFGYEVAEGHSGNKLYG